MLKKEWLYRNGVRHKGKTVLQFVSVMEILRYAHEPLRLII